MEQINSAQAQRVWQRVRGTGPDLIPRLLSQEAELRHTWQYLQRHSPLHDSRLLARLRENSQRFLSILSGLALISGEEATLTAPPAIRGNPEGLLRRSLNIRLQSASLLEQLPPEYAYAARQLTTMMEQDALVILELLGHLSRN